MRGWSSRFRRAEHFSDRVWLETLEQRAYLAVTASFSPGAGQLTVFGDALDNNITISRNAAGAILVNGGAVAITVGYPPGGTDAMVNDYLRRTRRTHAVVERVFWE